LELEKKGYELDQVRGTLLLNFHEVTGVHFRVRGVNEKVTTINLLMVVLDWKQPIGSLGLALTETETKEEKK